MVLSTFDLVVNRDAGTHRWTEARIFLINSSYTVITLYEIQPFRGDSSRLNCMSSALSELEAHRENRRTVKQGQNIGWNLGSEQWKPRFKRCIKIQYGAVLAISIFACFRDSSAVPVFHPISSL